MKGWMIRAQQPRSKRTSCKGQVMSSDSLALDFGALVDGRALVGWPLREIRSVLGRCPIMNTIIRKHTLRMGTPLAPFTAHAITHYSVSPRHPLLQYMLYNIGNGNIV